MGQVSPLSSRAGTSSSVESPSARHAASVRMIPTARCALCGGSLDERSQRFAVLSPQSVERTLTVCHLCRKAVLNEGYRPAD